MSSVGYELDSMWKIFEGSLQFMWGPHDDEPTIIANKIDLIADSIRHIEIPLEASRQIVADDMEDRFNREVDLRGKKWKKRSKTTIEIYKRRGQPYSTILRMNDNLFNAVTDPDSYVVVGNDLHIDTSSWPSYWHAQDTGQYTGRATVLPARPFVGISELASFKILEVFDDWIDGNLDIIKPGITGVSMFRGAFGRIEGRVGLSMAASKPRHFMFGTVTGTGTAGIE